MNATAGEHAPHAAKQIHTTAAKKSTAAQAPPIAGWHPDLRKRPPLAILQQAVEGRLPDVLPLRWQHMAASPFGFYRGSAALMAYDLSRAPNSGVITQICGDAHVLNLGAYEGIDGKLVFDLNDFDETARGPFEWDVLRMATSILLAGLDAKLKPAACKKAAAAFANAYFRLVRELATMPVLEVARYPVRRLDATTAILDILRQAERATPLHLLDRLTTGKGSSRHFRSQPPMLRPVTGKERADVLSSLPAYRESLLPERRHFLDQFTVLDVAFKVVGTGSIGLLDYILYMVGNGPGDPLFLQIKQEVASAYTPYLKGASARGVSEGERVADGQRAMQLQSDPMLGWTHFNGRDFLVRQYNDHRASLDLTAMDAEGLAEYAKVCGEILARGHARAGSGAAILAFCGKRKRFTDGVLAFATHYADQTIADWKTLCAAGLATAPPASSATKAKKKTKPANKRAK